MHQSVIARDYYIFVLILNVCRYLYSQRRQCVFYTPMEAVKLDYILLAIVANLADFQTRTLFCFRSENQPITVHLPFIVVELRPISGALTLRHRMWNCGTPTCSWCTQTGDSYYLRNSSEISVSFDSIWNRNRSKKVPSLYCPVVTKLNSSLTGTYC